MGGREGRPARAPDSRLGARLSPLSVSASGLPSPGRRQGRTEGTRAFRPVSLLATPPPGAGSPERVPPLGELDRDVPPVTYGGRGGTSGQSTPQGPHVHRAPGGRVEGPWWQGSRSSCPLTPLGRSPQSVTLTQGKAPLQQRQAPPGCSEGPLHRFGPGEGRGPGCRSPTCPSGRWPGRVQPAFPGLLQAEGLPAGLAPLTPNRSASFCCSLLSSCSLCCRWASGSG